ncbi:MAG: hypothetical protein LC620_02750 [Halobacteriales archaeon]|nr:hypothetical protein [Halobacteriales archaeon]
MYPFESRLQWLLHSSYGHLLHDLELNPHGRDSLLQERAASLRRWDRARTGVMVLLYLGVLGAAVAYASDFVPGLGEATPLVSAFIRLVGALTGLLTLAYLFLTRLLDQLEADIYMILANVG